MGKLTQAQRDEVAGRFFLKKIGESRYTLSLEYEIDSDTVRRIGKEYRDDEAKRNSALAAAQRYYEANRSMKRPRLVPGNENAGSERNYPEQPAGHQTHPGRVGFPSQLGQVPDELSRQCHVSSLPDQQFAFLASMLLMSPLQQVSQLPAGVPSGLAVAGTSQLSQGASQSHSSASPPQAANPVEDNLTSAQAQLASVIQNVSCAAAAGPATSEVDFQLEPALDSRLRNRKPDGFQQLVKKLEVEGIFSISQFDEYDPSDLKRWDDKDKDVVFLNDTAWSQKYWAEEFVSRHLSLLNSLARKNALEALKRAKIVSDCELASVISRSNSMEGLPLAAFNYIRKWAAQKSQGAAEDASSHAVAMGDANCDGAGTILAGSLPSPVVSINEGNITAQESHGNAKIHGPKRYEAFDNPYPDTPKSNDEAAAEEILAEHSRFLVAGGPSNEKETSTATQVTCATHDGVQRGLFWAAFKIERCEKLMRSHSQLINEENIQIFESAVRRDLALSKRTIEEFSFVGRGGFGAVFRVEIREHGAANRTVALKLEFSWERSAADSALCRERDLYYSRPRRDNNDVECPLPRLESLFSAGRNFATLYLQERMCYRMLCLEFLYERPQRILEEAGALFGKERRAGHEGRELLLQIMAGLLWLDERNISHNDLKEEHIFYRLDGSLVIIDGGLAQRQDTYVYTRDRARQSNASRNVNSAELDFVVPSLGNAPLRILGEPENRPGTRGYRTEQPVESNEERAKVNSFQYGMIIFRIVCPFSAERLKPESLERFVYSIAKLNFEGFKSAVLEHHRIPVGPSKRSRGQTAMRACALPLLHPDFGEDIMSLCYQLVQADPLKRLSCRAAFKSDFARNYIPADMSWHNVVKDQGFVIDPGQDLKVHAVLLWAKGRGYSIIPLFSALVGDFVGCYAGFLHVRCKPDGKDSSAEFSLHSIIWDGSNALNGKPCQKLPVDLMVEKHLYGSLFQSSRKHPQIGATGNVSSPNIPTLKRGNISLGNGNECHYVRMIVTKNIRFGEPYAWNYDFASMGCRDKGLTNDQVQGEMACHDSLPPKWQKIVLDRRSELLKAGFTDRKPDQYCSIHQCSHKENHFIACLFLYDQDADEALCLEKYGGKGIGNPKKSDQYWKMPDEIAPDRKKQISVLTDFYLDGILDTGRRDARRLDFAKIMSDSGVVILSEFFSSVPDGVQFYSDAESSNGSRRFDDTIRLSVVGSENSGDDSKRISPDITDENDPVAKALALVAREYLPEMVLARGKDANGALRTERCVVRQDEILNAGVLREQGICATVHQVTHSDKDPSEDGQFSKVSKKKLDEFKSDKGPVSIWVGQPAEDKTLSVVGYLGSHKPALRLWEHMARHYGPMREAYMHYRTISDDADFEKVWIGAARLFLEREHKGQDKVCAVRLSMCRWDALAMHGLFVHGGTDEQGYRLFAVYSSKEFTHCSNTIHTIPDSTAVAAMFDTVLQPLMVKNVFPRRK